MGLSNLLGLSVTFGLILATNGYLYQALIATPGENLSRRSSVMCNGLVLTKNARSELLRKCCNGVITGDHQIPTNPRNCKLLDFIVNGKSVTDKKTLGDIFKEGHRSPMYITATYRMNGGLQNGYRDDFKYPWIVGINIFLDGGRKVSTCTGSLISDKWLITAAHCVMRDVLDPETGDVEVVQSTASDIKVYVGFHDIDDLDVDAARIARQKQLTGLHILTDTYLVEEVFVHNDYYTDYTLRQKINDRDDVQEMERKVQSQVKTSQYEIFGNVMTSTSYGDKYDEYVEERQAVIEEAERAEKNIDLALLKLTESILSNPNESPLNPQYRELFPLLVSHNVLLDWFTTGEELSHRISVPLKAAGFGLVIQKFYSNFGYHNASTSRYVPQDGQKISKSSPHLHFGNFHSVPEACGNPNYELCIIDDKKKTALSPGDSGGPCFFDSHEGALLVGANARVKGKHFFTSVIGEVTDPTLAQTVTLVQRQKHWIMSAGATFFEYTGEQVFTFINGEVAE